jgi:hypothetical protein
MVQKSIAKKSTKSAKPASKATRGKPAAKRKTAAGSALTRRKKTAGKAR